MNQTEVAIDPRVQVEVAALLEEIESKTELEGCAIITYTGLRIAHADSTVGPSVDADLYSASPATLLALGNTVTQSLGYGEVSEIVVRGRGGYTIVTAAKDVDFIMLSTSQKKAKLGYFFKILRKTFLQAVEKLKDVKISAGVF